MSVEYIGQPEANDRPNLHECGWNGPGWYFWDETQAHCCGPYPGKEVAEQQMEDYAKLLPAFASVMPRPRGCQVDDCDAVHCPQCGGHKLDWYASGICSSCDLENRQKWEDEQADERRRFLLKSVQRCHALPESTGYDETHTLWCAGYLMNPDDGGESGDIWLTPKGYEFLGVEVDPKILAYLNLLLFVGEMENEDMNCNCITVHSWYGEGHCSGCPCEESQELLQTLKVLRPPGIGF